MLSLALLSSCSAMFNREYYHEQDYDADYYVTIPETDIREVHNYTGMRDALESMVTEHLDTGTLRTKNYTGNVEDDVARAQNHIKNDTPLGAFAVDYITPVIKEYLTYYEIELHMYYTRTPAEIAEVANLTGAELFEKLDALLFAFESGITFEITTLRISEASIIGYVRDFCDAHPELMPIVPNVVVTPYPNMANLRKIVRIEFRYPYSRDVLYAMRMNYRWGAPPEPVLSE